MTVFKTFLRVVEKNKAMIILYTVLLVVFGGINMENNQGGGSFTESKPSVLIENNDNSKVTESFVNYIYDKCEKPDIENNENAIKDALFYRDISIIVTIPEGFGQSCLSGNPKTIEIQTVGDYSATYVKLLIERYLKVIKIYADIESSEDKVIEKTQKTISNEVEIEITSKLDAGKLVGLTGFFNFMNYSIIAGCVYVICVVLATFREEKIRKRTLVSAMNYKTHNRQLLLCNAILAFTLWILYMILGIIKVGADVIFTQRGAMFLLNSFVFTICALCMAFLIGTLVNNKEAMNGIINVVALGSSFLCGAFVPAQWLPQGVLAVAHIMPSYWFINANDRLGTIEELTFDNLKPVFFNMAVVFAFAILFVVITNAVSKKKMRA